MVNLIRHFVISLVIFAMLFSLIGGIYSAVKTQYEFNETYTGDNYSVNIADAIGGLNIVEGMETFTEGTYSIVNPTNDLDVIGGLMSTALGSLQLLFGTFTLPFEIFGILITYYTVPTIVISAVGVIILISLGFIYLSSRARGKL